MERVDLLLRVQVHRARRLHPGDDRFAGLHISEQEVDALASGRAGLPGWATAPALGPEEKLRARPRRDGLGHPCSPPRSRRARRFAAAGPVDVALPPRSVRPRRAARLPGARDRPSLRAPLRVSARRRPKAQADRRRRAEPPVLLVAGQAPGARALRPHLCAARAPPRRAVRRSVAPARAAHRQERPRRRAHRGVSARLGRNGLLHRERCRGLAARARRLGWLGARGGPRRGRRGTGGGRADRRARIGPSRGRQARVGPRDRVAPGDAAPRRGGGPPPRRQRHVVRDPRPPRGPRGVASGRRALLERVRCAARRCAPGGSRRALEGHRGLSRARVPVRRQALGRAPPCRTR